MAIELRKSGNGWSTVVAIEEDLEVEVIIHDPDRGRAGEVYEWLIEHWPRLRKHIDEDLAELRADDPDVEDDDDLIDVKEPPSIVLDAPGEGALTFLFVWDPGGQYFTWELEDGELAGPMIE